MHLESGGIENNQIMRARQLQLLAVQHQQDESHVHFMCGDFNMRGGQDKVLHDNGCFDVAMMHKHEVHSSVDWRWKQGNSRMRFDRCYMHSSANCNPDCVEYKRLLQVWDNKLTDHVAISMLVRISLTGDIAASADENLLMNSSSAKDGTIPKAPEDILAAFHSKSSIVVQTKMFSNSAGSRGG